MADIIDRLKVAVNSSFEEVFPPRHGTELLNNPTNQILGGDLIRLAEKGERWRKRWVISFGFNLLFIVAGLAILLYHFLRH